MSNTKEIEITTGCVEYGWSHFSILLGSGTWTCRASFLGSHPLNELILAAVDIYDHLFCDSMPIPPENAVWYVSVVDEPGGIVLRIVPVDENVQISVFLHDMDFGLDPATLSTDRIVAEEIVDYWDFARAVYRDAARAIVRQGFTGLREGWEPNRWNIDSHFEVLPIEHFLFLACLVRNGMPRYGMTLVEELEILHIIKDEFIS